MFLHVLNIIAHEPVECNWLILTETVERQVQLLGHGGGVELVEAARSRCSLERHSGNGIGVLTLPV